MVQLPGNRVPLGQRLARGARCATALRSATESLLARSPRVGEVYETRNTQHATQYATHNTQHTQHATHNTQHTTRNTQHATRNTQHSTSRSAAASTERLPHIFQDPIMSHKLHVKNGSKDLKRYPHISRRVRDTPVFARRSAAAVHQLDGLQGVVPARPARRPLDLPRHAGG